jgi:hypothetical protein
MNHDGKDECIKEGVIEACWKYLDSPIMDQKIYTSYTIMSCTIHLDGKKQTVGYEANGQPLILQVH